jgi:hypothetical protein
VCDHLGARPGSLDPNDASSSGSPSSAAFVARQRLSLLAGEHGGDLSIDRLDVLDSRPLFEQRPLRLDKHVEDPLATNAMMPRTMTVTICAQTARWRRTPGLLRGRHGSLDRPLASE